MDPGTWALLAATASVASQGVTMLQEMQQADMDAAIAGQNAEIARRNAGQARLEAAQAEEAKRREVRETMGAAAAAASQSKTGGPAYGSNALVLTQGARKGELDALNIRYGGEMEAHANLTQAAQFDFDRRMAKRRKKGAVVSGIVGMGASALSGYSNYRAANATWGRMRNNGVYFPSVARG